MKTIKELYNAEYKKIYVFLADEEICKKFLQMAEDEGFLFGDGVKPTEKHCSDIIALESENSLCYVGSVGRMAFGSGANDILRVDFKKYLLGEKDFVFKK